MYKGRPRVMKNCAEAVTLYHRAIRHADPAATFHLGRMNASSRGVRKKRGGSDCFPQRGGSQDIPWCRQRPGQRAARMVMVKRLSPTVEFDRKRLVATPFRRQHQASRAGTRVIFAPSALSRSSIRS